jgi:hypothetical protein
MRNFFLVLLFLAGAILAGTANFQFTIGAILLLVAYVELRKTGVDINQFDDIILEKVREFTAREKNNG